jgi:hypothetical protein
MKRTSLAALFAGLIVLSWTLVREQARAAQGVPAGAASGQGAMRFRVAYTADHLPPEARAVLKGAHGGFALDPRPGRGETYFALNGAGIVAISSDLRHTRMVETAPEVRNTNQHNTLFWTAPDGSAYLTFPGNLVNRVFTTTLDGKLVHTLDPPGSADVGHPAANDYFAKGGPFVPTDVELLDGLFYIPTGYSKLDYVLTARLASTSPVRAEWHDLAFGGKGTGPGQFGTGHGIAVPPGTRRIDIADRPNSEIDRFTRFGQYIGTVKLPAGSFPCDVHYLGKYAVVGALHGPDRTKGAPIYVIENDQVISTIMIKEDLGLATFQHIHNAVLREVGGKLYIVAQAWNPGDFAILEQVN